MTDDAPVPSPPPSSTAMSPRMLAQRVEPTPRQEQLRRIAAANRALMEDIVGTEVDADDLASVAEELEALAARFRRDRPRSLYEGLAEAAMAGGPMEAFFDHSPLIGLANPLAPPILLDLGPEEVVGRVTFGALYEGPPGCVHGGFVAAAFDEVLGAAQAYSGAPGMTVRLTVNYRRPTPLRAPLEIVGRFDRIEGRKVFTSGRILSDGEVTAEAEGLFVSIDGSKFRELAERFDRRVGGDGGAA